MSGASTAIKGTLLLASIAFFWGINWPFMKIAVTHLPVFDFRFICAVIGGVGLLSLALLLGQSLRVPKVEIKPLLLCGLFNVVGWHVFSGFGLFYLPAGRATIIAFTMPVWATLLSYLILKNRPNWQLLLGLALGIAGLAILVGPDLVAFEETPYGALSMLGAASSWALGTVLIKRFTWTIGTASLAGWQQMMGVPVLGLGALLFSFDQSWIGSVDWAVILSVAYAATVPMIYCFWAWFTVVSLFPAPKAAVGTLAIPIVGVFSSAAVLGESVGLQELSALVLILGALISVLVLPHLTKARAPQPAP